MLHDPRLEMRAIASAVFPGVLWHGASATHVSHVLVLTGLDFHSAKVAVSLFHQKGIPSQFWNYLLKTFPGCQWLVTKQQFYQIFMTDTYRILTNKKPEHTRDYLLNPRTGSKFHRIAVKGRCVGGFRVLLGDDILPGNVGIRFRIQLLGKGKSSKATVMAEAVESVKTAVNEMTTIIQILDFKEPPKDDGEKTKIKILN